MNKKTGLSLLLFFTLSLGLLYVWHDSAEAARMGRSRSFGSRPTYQRSAPAPTQNPASAPAKSGQTASQPTPGAPQSPAGRWGGMLGGMLMGSLIGSMLFGGGRMAAGPGLLDLLLIGFGIFLLFRFLRTRRMAAETISAGNAMAFESGPAPAWGHTGYAPTGEAAAASPQPTFPPGFDADEFLKGANAVYVRLQTSWDKRDLDDIRQFTSVEVFNEIEQQAKEDPAPGKTELLLITPRILEVRDAVDQRIVTVLFDAMLRENEDQHSKQVRELWHFSQARENPDSYWILEGIQQVAA